MHIAYVNVFVNDLERARLSACGVGFRLPPTKQPWGGFLALVSDPGGNVFSLDPFDAVHP